MKPLAIWLFPAARGLHIMWDRLPGGKGTRSTHLTCNHRMLPGRPTDEDEITTLIHGSLIWPGAMSKEAGRNEART